MKAAVLRDVSAGLVIEDVALAPPKDHEVQLRILATGVCHSDLSTIRGKTGSALPLIPGHEAAGIVERVGAGVSRVKPGDRVVLNWAPACGHCFYCQESHPTLCDTYGAAAGAGALWDGTSRLGPTEAPIGHYTCISSFAEQAVVPETACIPLPQDVPFEIGALIGCAVTTGFGAVVNDARTRPGDAVAVVGIGGVGVNALLAARLAGAMTVIAVDSNPAKRAVALENGATHFLLAGEDTPEAVRALTLGRGADQVVECTGHPGAMAAAYAMTRPAGRLVIVGIAAKTAQFSIPAIGFPGSKKQIFGSIYGGGVPERDITRILALYADGRLPLDRQIGARLPLAQVNEALALLEQGVLARSILTFA